jgi:DNA-binding transcriptional regulator YiaG
MVTSDSIKAARNKVGESQDAFGRRFGVHQSTVDRWETKGPPARGPGRMAIERELALIEGEKTETAPVQATDAEAPQ